MVAICARQPDQTFSMTVSGLPSICCGTRRRTALAYTVMQHLEELTGCKGPENQNPELVDRDDEIPF